MLFEDNDFISTLSTLGLDMTNYINDKKYGYERPMNYNSYKDDSSMFVSSDEGFQRGNLYRNEYKPYKSMTYLPLRAKNDKEEKLFKVHEYCFAITDLSFYLDLNPEDQRAFELFKRYANLLENATRDYERVYGPLSITSAVGEVYDWADNPWPWDQDRGSMYV